MELNTEKLPMPDLPNKAPDFRSLLNSVFSLFRSYRTGQPYLARLLDSTQKTPGGLKGGPLLWQCLAWTLIAYSFGWIWFIAGIWENPDIWYKYVIAVAFDLSLIFVCFLLTYWLYQEREALRILMRDLGISDPFKEMDQKFERRERIVIAIFVIVTIALEWFAFRTTATSNFLPSLSSLFASALIGISGGSWAYYLYGTFYTVSANLSRAVDTVMQSCNPIQPGKTIELRQLLNLVARHLGNSAIAFAVPLSLGFIFWRFSQLSGFMYSYLIGLIIMWGTLLIPLVQMLNAISFVTRQKKLETLGKLETSMKSTSITEQSSETFQKLTALYQLIDGNSALPIDLGGIGRVAISFALTLLPIVVKYVFGIK
jgi:hypothetical protein